MRTPRFGRTAIAILAAGIAVAAAACGSSSSASSLTPAAGRSPATVSTVHNGTLGATVLVDASGRTLYTLSAEGNGKFICTKSSKIPGTTTSCTSLWHPLIAHGAVTGNAVGSLGTVMRPDGGGLQVTFRGRPLYTFADDHAAGDAAGNGLRDVGVWRAATIGAAGGGSTGGSTGGGGGGYGYGY